MLLAVPANFDAVRRVIALAVSAVLNAGLPHADDYFSAVTGVALARTTPVFLTEALALRCGDAACHRARLLDPSTSKSKVLSNNAEEYLKYMST